MTKIMLVEDDNNLREIYEARLSAEGYSIVSAQDGEAALALAAKERPDLIITDVMMPKISGFEMLDILRNTEGLKDVKVIMLTALGQAEDNARAGALGADRYLVKSQVTLEDIVKAAHDVVEGPADETADEAAVAAAPAPAAAEQAAQSEPVQQETEEPVQTEPVATPAEPVEVVAPSDHSATPDVADQGATEADPDHSATPEAVTVSEPVSPEPDISAPEEQSAPEQEPVNDTPAANPIEVVEPPQPPSLDLPDVPPAVAADSAQDATADDTSSDDTGAAVATSIDGDNATSTTDTDDAAPSQAAEPASPQAEEQTVKAEQAAEPASQEESEMRAKIDQFIEDGGNGSEQENPEEASTLPDEDEAEYEKDDRTPDMGQLSVHEPKQPPEQPAAPQPQTAVQPAEQPAAAAPPEPVSAAPGYPSQPYELPSMQGAAIGQESPSAEQPQAAPSDKVVSDAITDMIASTPNTAAAGTGWQSAVETQAAAPSPSVQPAAVGAQAPLGEPSQPSATQAQPQAEQTPNDTAGQPPLNQQGGGSVHSRLVAPLGTSGKPDINQLLSMEEAKSAAQGAANQFAPPAVGQPQPPAWQPGQQPPQTGGQSIDPNSISL